MTKYYKRTPQGLEEVSVIDAQALRDGEKVIARTGFESERDEADKNGYTDLDIIEIVNNDGLSNWGEEEQKYILGRYRELLYK